MMARLTGVGVALLLSVGYAQAQGCPTCFVAGNTDTPAMDGAPYPGFIAGWGFECGSGAGVDQIDIYYSDDTAPNGIRRVKDYVIYFAEDRPDVMIHYLPICPRVHSNTGWAVYPTTPIPSGRRTIWIVMKKASRYLTQKREVDVP
jgi:hypothetical protein